MEVADRLNEGLTEEMLETARRAVSSVLATVPGSNPDAEDSVIGQQQWQAIHERRVAGQGISQMPASSSWIARRCEAACGRAHGSRTAAR